MHSALPVSVAYCPEALIANSRYPIAHGNAVSAFTMKMQLAYCLLLSGEL